MPVIPLDNDSHCENCGRAIGRLEQVYAWNAHAVCFECHGRLRTQHATTGHSSKAEEGEEGLEAFRLMVGSGIAGGAIILAGIIVLCIAYSEPADEYKSLGDWFLVGWGACIVGAIVLGFVGVAAAVRIGTSRH